MQTVQRTSVEDLGSFKLVVTDDDKDISRQVRENKWYTDEDFETRVFAGQLREGMRVLDIGGNIGFYAMLARSIVGPAGSVVVFEPYPKSIALIRASIDANRYTNVHLVEAAVTDEPGVGKLFLSPDFWTEHSLLDLGHDRPADDGYEIEVPLVQVDEALERIGQPLSVDFIKMDIEGFEWRALKGMRRVLDASPHLAIMTEFWPNGFTRGGSTPGEFLRSLAAEGFSFQNIDNEQQRLVPLTIGELTDLVERNARRTFENPVMKAWGWYTNLLCTR